jgi:hypothetical protein
MEGLLDRSWGFTKRVVMVKMRNWCCSWCNLSAGLSDVTFAQPKGWYMQLCNSSRENYKGNFDLDGFLPDWSRLQYWACAWRHFFILFWNPRHLAAVDGVSESRFAGDFAEAFRGSDLMWMAFFLSCKLYICQRYSYKIGSKGQIDYYETWCHNITEESRRNIHTREHPHRGVFEEKMLFIHQYRDTVIVSSMNTSWTLNDKDWRTESLL